MQFVKKLMIVAGFSACLKASAISVPSTVLTKPVWEDSTFHRVAAEPEAPVLKKQGFFGKLKNKLLALALKPSEGKSDTKKTLGWVSIGMFVLGVALAPLGAGAASIVLIPAGVIVGIVALLMRGDPNNKTERRNSRLLAILGVVLGLGLIIGLAIALSGAKWG